MILIVAVRFTYVNGAKERKFKREVQYQEKDGDRNLKHKSNK